MEKSLDELRKVQVQHAVRQQELLLEIENCTINTDEYFRLQREWIAAMRDSTNAMQEIIDIYQRANKTSSIYIK